jgi:phosphoglycolate phosphatase
MTVRPFAHVVFDWDGTLVDTIEPKARNAADVMAAAWKISHEPIRAAYLLHSGVPRRVLFDRIASQVAGRALEDDEFAGLSAAFTAANLAMLGHAPLQPGVGDTLAALAGRGVRMAVSSSAPAEDLDPRVEQSGLRGRFDLVMGSRPGFGKGAEHLRAACERWGVPVDRVLVVGDEAADVALARAAGAAVAIVGPRRMDSVPDYRLTSIADLLPLCA